MISSELIKTLKKYPDYNVAIEIVNYDSYDSIEAQISSTEYDIEILPEVKKIYLTYELKEEEE